MLEISSTVAKALPSGSTYITSNDFTLNLWKNLRNSAD